MKLTPGSKLALFRLRAVGGGWMAILCHEEQALPHVKIANRSRGCKTNAFKNASTLRFY